MPEGRARRPAEAGRIQVIDALRGVAALSVLGFHLLRSSPQAKVLAATFPRFLDGAFDYSRSGVAIFFVISGFVIAYTTRSIDWSGRSAGRFIARRQLRLDPPYYAAMALVLVSSVVKRLIPGLVYQTFTAREVLVNMVYLQGILNVPAVLDVSWTLCLEVQFYLFVLLAGVVAAWLSKRRQLGGSQVLALAAGVVSLALYGSGTSVDGWFIGLWWMFCTGMVVCWYFVGRVTRSLTLGWFAATLVMCIAAAAGWGGADPWLGEWVALGTGLLLFALVEARRTAWVPPRILLFFGTISYSLYLVHLPVIDVVMAAGYKAFGQSRAGAVLCWVAGAAGSIAAAWVLHRAVEAPAIRWARRVRAPERLAQEPDLAPS